MFQSGLVWKDIARLLEIESIRHSPQNDATPESFSGEDVKIIRKEALDQLLEDINVIRKEVYDMPEELLTPSHVEAVLKKYFKVLNTIF